MSKIEVCTVWAPRPDLPQWRDDYVQMLHAQRHSALNFGHRHLVVSDSDLGAPFEQMRVELPDNLMHAMIAGVIARLRQPMNGPIVFVDVDCLIDRDCSPTFQHYEFDLGLTFRDNDVAPINNGAMFVSEKGQGRALMFFLKALEICQPHWGGDQEAISKIAAPVAYSDQTGERGGALVRFLSSKLYAAVPKVRLARHDSCVVHFKGQKKEWMLDYARKYHGWREA